MDIVQILGDTMGHIHPIIEGKYHFFDSFIPIILAELLYAFFVFKWGPDLMRNRAAMNLKPAILAYNISQIIINVYLATNVLPKLLQVNLFCTPVGKYPQFDQYGLRFGYCYALLKIADFIETVFFVLRKKFEQVSFLHVYHHMIMAVAVWYTTRTYPGGNLGWMIAINSMVHAFMYSYYLLSNLGYHNLWWKKYVTQFQLQLVSTKIPEEQWFTPKILMDMNPSLKAIIDLTATDRYYNPMEFTSKGLKYKKISIRGSGQVPTDRDCTEFYNAVDDLLKVFSDDEDALIGVHCTHGLNRTGYLICKYMVARMKIDPNEAIRRFQDARGYEMERPAYVRNIRLAVQDQNESSRLSTAPRGNRFASRNPPEKNWRDEPRNEPRGGPSSYRSPFAECYDDEKSSRARGRYPPPSK